MAETGPVKQALARKPSEKPGSLSTRFVRDLVGGSLLNEHTSHADLPVHDDTTHEFYPTVEPTYDQAALYCKRCHLHFFIHSQNNMPPPPGGDAHIPCGTPSVLKDYPAHHLVEEEFLSGYEACQEASQYYHIKYHPVAIIVRFSCSIPTCAFRLIIEISPPRLIPGFTSSLTNQAGLDARKQQAVKAGLISQEGASKWATPKNAIFTANRVLNDLITSPYYNGKLRKFDVRTNAKFLIIFGGENLEWLRYLELNYSVAEPDGDEDEEASAVWRFPEPLNDSDDVMPDGKTKRLVGNRKTFYHECLTELTCLTADESSTGNPTQHIVHQSLRVIVMGVGTIEKRQALTDNDHDNHPAYKTLGVLRADSSKMVLYAFDRQVVTCPSLRAKFADALVEVSVLRGDSELQLRAAQERSFAEQPPEQENASGDAADDALAAVLDAAYKYLLVGGVDVTAAKLYPDISIIGLAKNRLEACPSDTTTLDQLEVIANARNSNDIRNFIDVMKVEAAGGPMSPDAAYGVLDLSYSEIGSADNETIVNVVRANLSESTHPDKKKAQALRVIASLIGNDPTLLADANALDPQPGFVVTGVQKPGAGPVSGVPVAPMAGVHAEIPVGLYNIGNTCYLNSILQYLYTLKPVRNLLSEFEAHKLDLSAESVSNRRIGGNKTRVERAEAIAAQQFVQELSWLFDNLHTCPRTYVRPKQRLANAALLSVPQLLANAKKQKGQQQQQQTAVTEGPPVSPVPPQLPPRPPASTQTESPLSSPPAEDVDMVNSGTTAVTGATAVIDQETASRSSTQTLVNNEGDGAHPALDSTSGPKVSVVAVDDQPSESEPDGDVQMEDAATAGARAGNNSTSRPTTPSTARPEDDEPEVEDLIRKALDNSDRSGTAQQDVEEVMGNIMLRMQEAIKSTGEGTLDGKTHIQLDPIMETFYCVLVNLTAKAEGDGTLEEIAHERWITAYPDEKVGVSMYEALDRTFDKQFLDGTQRPRYTVIRHLPPILHICIQRSAANGQKNLNKVEIPHVLHLDRYMEDVEDNGELSELRDRAWEIKLRLGKLRNHTADQSSAGNPSTRASDAAESHRKADDGIGAAVFGDAHDNDEGVDVEDSDVKMAGEVPTLDSETATLNPDEPATPLELGISPADETAKREAELTQLWAGRSEYEYNLHAIICHSGAGSGFGHYWVFVHDFERKVWYRYNDETVTKHTDEECMNMIESKGNPYYVAYIRGGSQAELVDIPERNPEPDSDQDAPGEEDEMPPLLSAEGHVVYGPQPRPPTVGWTNSDAAVTETIEGLDGKPHPGKREMSVEVEMGGMNPIDEGRDHLPSYEESESVQTNGVMNMEGQEEDAISPRGRCREPGPSRPLSSNPTLERQLSKSDPRSPTPRQ